VDEAKIQSRLRRAKRFDPVAHVPLLCEGARVGWLRRSHAQRLMAWPEIFRRDAEGVRIDGALDSPAARSAAVGEVIHALHREGAITGWRDERYAVATHFDAPPLFQIERAAARYFGTMTYAAHANGYCGSGTACEMWLARRAASKPIDPGMLDNLVGGGMSAGTPPMQTIVREAREEAGIPAEVARKAVAAGTIDILREVPEGVQSELIFVHDLKLSRSFQPHNEDGEVAEFRRLPIVKVIEIIESGADLITLDASLVAMAYIIRSARGSVPADAKVK